MPTLTHVPRTGLLAGLFALALVARPVVAQQTSDSAQVASVIARFHAALESGDSATAIALLAPGALILESGGVETFAEYRSGHLPGDIEFSRAIKGVRNALRVTVKGDLAWAAATSTTKGEFRGRPVNSAGAELVIFERGPGGWRIAAIHWSSRRLAPPPSDASPEPGMPQAE